MIDCAAVAQAWEEWKMERAMEETFKKPRDFWILLKWSPYRPQVYTAVDLGDNGLENLRAQEEVVHVREVLGE